MVLLFCFLQRQLAFYLGLQCPCCETSVLPSGPESTMA